MLASPSLKGPKENMIIGKNLVGTGDDPDILPVFKPGVIFIQSSDGHQRSINHPGITGPVGTAYRNRQLYTRFFIGLHQLGEMVLIGSTMVTQGRGNPIIYIVKQAFTIGKQMW
jgi:hypothetical protein